MNILVLLTVVCCTAAAVPLLSEDGGQKETLAMVNGSSPGNVILRPRDKRGLQAVGKWVGKTLASSSIGGVLSYFMSMGLDKLFDKDEITPKLNRISFELKDISAKLQSLNLLVLTQSTKADLECLNKIAYYGNILNHELHGSDEMLWEDILNYNSGIHVYLYQLSNLINGSTKFGGLSGVNEPFLVKLLELYTYYSDMKNFVPIDDLGNQMKNAIIKLLEYQKLGYQIKYNATMLKMNSTNRAQMNSMLVGIEKEHNNKVKQQNSSILALLKDCPNIKDQLAKKHWLNCTDGFRFGSICTQVCNSQIGYPNKGYEPVQCLWNGKWSNNIAGETRFMCTNAGFRNTKLGYIWQDGRRNIMCENGACDKIDIDNTWCYAEDGSGWGLCVNTIRPGYLFSDPNKKCNSVCMFMSYTFMKGWCYVDDAYYYWDYCMPEIMTGEPERTVRGELCKDRCEGARVYYHNSRYPTCNRHPYGTSYGSYCARNW